ncbi:MAG: phosphotyrosine protein phosphatase [Acidobacteriaceae bacterium]
MRHVLFVCGKNRRRSPTAEAIFSGIDGIEVSSSGTATDAYCPVSADLIEWANDIVVMEERQARQLRKRLVGELRNNRLVSLNIADRYALMQPELIEELRAKASRWIK